MPNAGFGYTFVANFEARSMCTVESRPLSSTIKANIKVEKLYKEMGRFHRWNRQAGRMKYMPWYRPWISMWILQKRDMVLRRFSSVFQDYLKNWSKQRDILRLFQLCSKTVFWSVKSKSCYTFWNTLWSKQWIKKSIPFEETKMPRPILARGGGFVDSFMQFFFSFYGNLNLLTCR